VDVQFQYPEALWLLGCIPLFVLIYFQYQIGRKQAIKKLGDPQLVKRLFPNFSSGKRLFRFLLLLLLFACGCLALANPRKPDTTTAEARKGIDMAIALDVSNSMLATDITPNRLTRAKQVITRLMDQMPDDRIGLILFAGNAYVQVPLTFDHEMVRMYVNNASPAAIAAQGTSIADALKKCDLILGAQQDRFRSIVLITDGETHDENAQEMAGQLAQKGMMINTLGIGSAEGATILDSTGTPKKDPSGQVVISKLNEPLLQQIATTTHGRYIHLETADGAVHDLLEQFSQIDKKALGDLSLYNYVTFYQWLAAPMLLFLLIELFLPERKKVVA
jgi:Ca-activated chloride channel homolog